MQAFPFNADRESHIAILHHKSQNHQIGSINMLQRSKIKRILELLDPAAVPARRNVKRKTEKALWERKLKALTALPPCGINLKPTNALIDDDHFSSNDSPRAPCQTYADDEILRNSGDMVMIMISRRGEDRNMAGEWGPGLRRLLFCNFS